MTLVDYLESDGFVEIEPDTYKRQFNDGTVEVYFADNNHCIIRDKKAGKITYKLFNIKDASNYLLHLGDW